MITKEQLLDALRHVEEPSMHKSLVDLQWIKDVLVKPERISLTIIMVATVEQYKIELEKQIRSLVESLTDIPLHIRFRRVTPIEAKQAGISGVGEEGAQKTHAQGLQSQLLSPDSQTKFIAVASGKGGVGKSTVTVNLSVALARLGKKVGIIDADIYGFSVPDMMGIEERPQMANGKTIIPVERFGVKVISMGFFVEDNAPIIWRGPMLGKMLRNFFAEVQWGELDYMLLDLPPGTGDVALDVHQMIPHSQEIIVTTPHATAAFVAARAGAMALHTKHEIIGIVENMAYYECGSCGEKAYIFGRGGGAKLAEEVHADLLAQIPLGAPDNHPSEADFSTSVYKENTATGQIYQQLAQQVVNKTS